MYDINTKNVKKGKKFYLVFLAFGLFFLIIMGGILISMYVNSKSLDAKTTSTKVIVNSHTNNEGSTMYSPTYYYVVDGVEYSCSSNSSSSINPGTNNKTVYYDSKNPSKCMTDYSKSTNKLLLIFLLLPIVFIIFAVVNMRKISKRVKAINELNQNGKLVKNLPYHLENTGMSVNHTQIKRPVVEYTLTSGTTITLYGDPRHDRKSADHDGMVDLVIDENNPDNYFIDFEINRLSGNLPSDYFNSRFNSENQYNNINYQTNNNIAYSNQQQNQILYQQNYSQTNLEQQFNSNQNNNINN